ncbi:DUF3667 domain-containing protein [Altererythrobacter sp.]|uniref:DUF3667 domain-containing protein n=1 Tax=Altererythrobacter sp. TaxID=1872480 RepID=UPI003D0EB8D4
MSEIGEAIGTAVEGGLLARIVGGARGGHVTDKDGNPLEKGHFAEGTCLNCGTELTGAHCHACGQKAHLHRTIGAFMHDLMHGALHLDGKIWRTLPLLAFKPGQLTRRYIDGERMRFVSPMALFLFSVFLMFAVFQIVGLTAPTEIKPNVDPEKTLNMVREGASEQRERIQERLDALPADSPERAELEAKLADADEGLEGIEQVEKFTLDKSGTVNFNLTGIEALDEGLIKKWKENPSLMLYKLQASAYKFSWLLIPLSIPFVWLLFAWKRRFKAYDHAIFVTYSLAFMSLLFIALSVLATAGIGGGWVFLALLVIPPVHIYKQLRGTYELSRFSAFWRMAVLCTIIVLVVLLLFLWLLVLLGAF